MWLNTMRFIALLLTALVLAPALAHLLELVNKIHLSREGYLTVQQIYRGWSLLGILVFGALVSTLILTITVRGNPKAFMLTLTSFICMAGAQVVFWIYTYPANRQTSDWTMLPSNWMHLRTQWEYSHAAGALLNLVALVTLILSILVKDE